MQQNWFRSWFNSPYYHILYKKRDAEEAQFFMDNLVNFLQCKSNDRVLDIACGRGRHAIYLNHKGLDVTGIDLSQQNIRFAQQYETPTLHFLEHDMRKLFYIHYFQFALNLFTSFGYFDNDYEHICALKAFQKSLKTDGLLVLDYFNTQKIIENLKVFEQKTIEGIDFNISKSVKNGKIVKEIDFTAEGQNFHFEELVQAFSKADFERLFVASGLEVKHVFGDYKLNPFTTSSDRLIFICGKKL